MANPPDRTPSKEELNAAAVRAAQIGDLPAARKAFAAALASDKRNAVLHYNLAVVDEQLDAIDDAAAGLTTALRLRPQLSEAARRLSRLLARYRLADPGRLDPAGLKAAFSVRGIALQPIAEAALARVFFHDAPLTGALAIARKGDPLAVARQLVLTSTNIGLSNPVLLLALAAGVVRSPSIERLLTAIRRVILLEAQPSRFDDRAFAVLALALVTQGWNNDHAWAEAPEEIAALERLEVDRTELFSGSFAAGRNLLLKSLYRPLGEIIGDAVDPLACSAIRPKMLRELVTRQLGVEREIREAARGLAHLAELTDETSKRVASQYARSPYPRWTTVHASDAGAMKRALGRQIGPERLGFMDGEFDVLIAGAGTGQQALQSAFAYGPKARLLALDISAPSLGYARHMASVHNAGNIEFLVGDILHCDKLDRQFDIIECVGVLHHMADPRAGLRRLLERLKPRGLLYLGLYSAISRRNITALRAQPDYPRPGCSDTAARAYRAKLMAAGEDEPGAELKSSRNFFTLNEFRDLVLHEHEQHFSLLEIEQLLTENRLNFRGFVLDAPVLARFASTYPDAPWPGRLADWARFEGDNPRTFDGMLRFWCVRAE
jgi:SAM-dependent methyltransferase